MGFIVTGSEDFNQWFSLLEQSERRTLNTKIEILKLWGPSLGQCQSNAPVGSRYFLRELAAKETLRIAYGAYPEDNHAQEIILLLGSGRRGDDHFDKRFASKADQIWLNQLAEEKELRRWEEVQNQYFTPQEIEADRQSAQQEVIAIILRELWEMAGKTQAEVADLATVTQAELSNIKNENNQRLAILHRYIAALGGELEIVARFGDKSIRIRGI